MRFFRFAVLVFASFGFLVFASFGFLVSEVRSQEPTLRLGSWNIQWLGKPEKRSNVAQEADDIAKYLRTCKVDILCLNEISANVEGGFYRTNTTLNDAFAKLNASDGQRWQHMLFPSADPNDSDLLCGVAWNAERVTLVGQPFRLPIRRAGPSAFVWARHPHAVKFSTGESKSDLVVIPIHMKSNRGGEEYTTRQRAQEAKTLLRVLGLVQSHFADDDIVIIGDSNMLKATEVSHARYTYNGFRDLNAMDQLTWIKDRRYDAAPFDRIFVPDDQPEFKNCEMTVCRSHHLEDEPAFRSKLSDHYLVVTEVPIRMDDD